MFTISKEFGFEAAHMLDGLPADHQCSRMHGHSYKAIFTFQSMTLNKIGFVRDYHDFDTIKNWIKRSLDHRFLNDIFSTNPTAEYIAYHLFEKFCDEFPELVSVTIKETDKTSAKYEITFGERLLQTFDNKNND